MKEVQRGRLHKEEEEEEEEEEDREGNGIKEKCRKRR